MLCVCSSVFLLSSPASKSFMTPVTSAIHIYSVYCVYYQLCYMAFLSREWMVGCEQTVYGRYKCAMNPQGQRGHQLSPFV